MATLNSEAAKCQECQKADAVGEFYVRYLNSHWEDLCSECASKTIYSAFWPIELRRNEK